MAASFPRSSGQLIVKKVFDAAVSGTVPAGTMVSLTRTGTIIDKVAPSTPPTSLTTLSASTTGTFCPCDMGNQAFVAGYLDTTNGSAITLIACSVSGSTITAGSPVVVSTSTSNTFHVCKLSSTLGVIVYNDTTNASTQTAKAFSLSGTTITLGAAQTTSTSVNTAGGFSLWRTSNTTFLFAFNDSANLSRLSLVAGSVSGTTVTVGTQVQVSTSTNTATLSNIAVLSATSFVLVFNDSTNSNKFSAVAGSISTNTITLGSVVNGTDGGSSSQVPYIAVLDATHFVFVSSGLGICVFGLVAGTVVTLGSPVSASAASNTSYRDQPGINIFPVDATHAYAAAGYITATNDTTGTFTTLTLINSPCLFLSSSLSVKVLGTSNSASATLSGGTGAGSQLQNLNSSFTSSILISNSSTRAIAIGVSGTGIAGIIVDVYGPGNPNNVGQFGITLVAGQAGQSVPVVVAGIVTGFSGLTQGNQVFVAGDGSLNSAGLGVAAAFALNSSTIILRKSITTTVFPVVLSP